MVDVKVDGVFVLVTVALAGGAYLYFKRNDIADSIGEAARAINPASRENVIFQAVDGPRFRNAADTVFSVIDILNPFNESDAFARQNLGL